MTAEERFAAACIAARERDREQAGGIGTLSEKTLHAAVKRYIEPDESFHEVKFGGFVADICREGHIFEVQTGSFTPLRKKLELMLDYGDLADVTVVYPMAAVKYLMWTDPSTGEVTPPRRSPRRAKPIDACYELIRIKYLLDNPRFRLKLLMLELTEVRVRDGRRSRDGKRGSHRSDRLPARLVAEHDFLSPEDYGLFIPEGLPGRFTISDFARAAAVSYDCAQRAVTILLYLGLITEEGREGRTKIFSR